MRRVRNQRIVSVPPAACAPGRPDAIVHRSRKQRKEQTMPTKISVICDNPVDPEAFEEAYPAQLVLAGALPGLQRIESAKGWPERGRYANAGVSHDRPLFRRLRRRE